MIPLRDSVRSSTTPYVTWLLIAANVAVFLYQLLVESRLEEAAAREVLEASRRLGLPFVPAEAVSLRAQELYAAWLHEWGLVPLELRRTGGFGEYVTLLTSMFLHANWLHLLGNLWFLWIFGDNVEDRLGHVPYVFFYAAAGLAAAGAQFVFDPGSEIPMIGASGAIAGVLGAYLVLFPRARVLTLVPIFIFLEFLEVPAVLFLLVWFVFQNLAPAAFTPAAEGGVAYWAHIGGFVVGAAFCWLLRNRLRARPVERRAYPGAWGSLDAQGRWRGRRLGW